MQRVQRRLAPRTLAVYTEALTRTLSTNPGERNGVVMCAFTPLKGISSTVSSTLPS